MPLQRPTRSFPEYASLTQQDSTTSARRAAAVVVFLVLAALANCERGDPARAVQPQASLEQGGERLSNANEVYTP
jgi:hypothetical protein